MDSDAEKAIHRESTGTTGGPAGGATAATDPAWPPTGDRVPETAGGVETPGGIGPIGGVGSAGDVGSASETADALVAERMADLVVDPTGDERVDEALARLNELGRTGVAGHVEIFDDVRHRLQEVLTSIDQDRPRPPAPSSP